MFIIDAGDATIQRPGISLSLADQQARRPASPRFLCWCTGLAQLVLPPLLILLSIGCPVSADQDAKRLYEDLLTDYNRLIRPVGNNSDRLTVKLGLKLSQLIDVVSIRSKCGSICICHPFSLFICK